MITSISLNGVSEENTWVLFCVHLQGPDGEVRVGYGTGYGISQTLVRTLIGSDVLVRQDNDSRITKKKSGKISNRSFPLRTFYRNSRLNVGTFLLG